MRRFQPDRKVWMIASACFVGLLGFKQAVWEIVISQVKTTRAEEHKRATENYKKALENGKKFNLPPMTEEEKENFRINAEKKKLELMKKL